jgi:NADH-quinone oxidoreductase subunit J
MGIVAYFIAGALAGLTALRATRARSRFELALWVAGSLAFLVVAVFAASKGIRTFPDLLFHFLALVCVISAIRVVTQTNPVHSAVWLITVFLCMAVLFILRDAEFLAAVQVIIYAGAIMVLYVFIIIFVDIEATAEEPTPLWMTLSALGIGTGLLLVLSVAALNLRSAPRVPVREAGYGVTEEIGKAIYFGALVPFEAVSLVLLVALVGATLIGKAEKD